VSNIVFTVFTPTYNRAHTLRRVYESLCRQEHEIFEWLVVDDGSTDATAALLDELAKTAPFPMRVVWQENGGKHRAHNSAIRLAKGEFTVILDSDDELVPGALRVLAKEWGAIASEERAEFAAMLGRSVIAGGELTSDAPAPYVDGHHFELIARGAMVGEKLPCYRTKTLREFPFSDEPGSRGVIPEGTVWLKIGQKYKVRCLQWAVRIYHRDPNDTGSLMNSYKGPESNAWGSLQLSLVVLNLIGDYWPNYTSYFLRASVNCTRYALHCRAGLFYPATHLKGVLSWVLWIAGLPMGIAIWLIDMVRRMRLRPRLNS
jgi:hypothetical protein